MKDFYEDIDFTIANIFRIKVVGELDKSLSNNLGGLSINYKIENNKTISHLEGEIIDQAELIGILNTLYNMRFKIISVNIKEKTTI